MLADIREVKQFFDDRAAGWDTANVHDPRKLSMVATLAQIKEGSRVLDLACGTGVLFAYLLESNPSEILGVDLSSAMIEKAGEKFDDPRIRLKAADFFTLEEQGFDVITVYSAYPHFADKDKLMRKACECLNPGGRILVAHSESRHGINSRHSGGKQVKAVSVPLRAAKEEAAAFTPYFHLDIIADTPEFYVISGTKK